MGIDGIGSGGPPGGIGGPQGPGGPSRPKGTGESFGVERGESKSGADAVGPSEALGRLERGEIRLDQYLDQSVDAAVSHLSGKLPKEQLDFVRTTLREEMAHDPVLVELVKRTTGAVPNEPSQ